MICLFFLHFAFCKYFFSRFLCFLLTLTCSYKFLSQIVYKIMAFIWSMLIYCLLQYGKTALLIAAEKGYTETCKLPVEAGADLSIRNQVSLCF